MGWRKLIALLLLQCSLVFAGEGLQAPTTYHKPGSLLFFNSRESTRTSIFNPYCLGIAYPFHCCTGSSLGTCSISVDSKGMLDVPWYIESSEVWTNGYGEEQTADTTPSSVAMVDGLNNYRAGTQGSLSDATGFYHSYTSGTVVGNRGGWHTNGGSYYQPRWDPIYLAVIKTPSSLSLSRIRMTMTTNSNSTSDIDTLPGAGGAAIIYNPDIIGNCAGTNRWCLVSSTNTFTDPGVNVLEAAVVADTRYVLMIRWMNAGATIEYYINGAYAGESTNVPASTTNLGWQLDVQTRESGVGKTINISKVMLHEN